MPNAKKYIQQREMPFRIGAPADSNRLPAISGTAEGLKQLSGAIGYTTDLYNRRAEQRADEYNNMKVLEASNTFAQEIDQHIQDVRQNKKGSLANNAYKESNDWFDKTVGEKYEPNLENDYQRQLFQANKVRMKTALLDNISKHQAREHLNYQNSIASGNLATITIDIQNNVDKGLSYLDEKVGQGIVQLRSVKQGLDTRAEEVALKKELHLSYITSKMAASPRAALADLNSDKFNDTITGDARMRLTTRIENEIDRRDSEYLFNTALKQYAGDPEAQAEFINKSAVSNDAKNKAFSKLSTEIQRQYLFKQIAQNKSLKETTEKVAGLVADGNFVDAESFIDSDGIRESIGNTNYLNLKTKVEKLKKGAIEDSPENLSSVLDRIKSGEIMTKEQIKAQVLSKGDINTAKFFFDQNKRQRELFSDRLYKKFEDRTGLDDEELESEFNDIWYDTLKYQAENKLSFDEAEKKFNEILDIRYGKEKSSFLKRTGDIIATGGGLVPIKENMQSIEQPETLEAEKSPRETWDMIQENENLLKVLKDNLTANNIPITPYNLSNLYLKNKDKINERLNIQPEF